MTAIHSKAAYLYLGQRGTWPSRAWVGPYGVQYEYRDQDIARVLREAGL